MEKFITKKMLKFVKIKLYILCDEKLEKSQMILLKFLLFFFLKHKILRVCRDGT